MFEFLILLLLSWSTHGHPETQSITRIVGGKDAPEGIAPYQVSVRQNYLGNEYHICGGSIINKKWVLSAAHCFLNDDLGPFTVVVGTNSLTSGGDRYNVSNFIPHEYYSETMLTNDVAVLKIKGEFTFGDKINAIKLATKDIGAGEECLVTGWGYVNNRETTPDKLQMLTVKTITVTDCNKVLSRESNIPLVTKNQACTFTMRGQGVCQGDSGGPLVSNGEVVGIVSWGVPCGRGYPDVFAKVYAYLDWINRYISN